MVQVSEVTGKIYNDEDYYFYRNVKQQIFMLEHNCIPADVFAGGDHKLVMAFSKKDHKRILPLWMANKPKKDGDVNNG